MLRGRRWEAEGRGSIFSCPHNLQRHILHAGARSHASLQDSQVRVLGMGVAIPAEVGRPEGAVWGSCEVHSAHERKTARHDRAEEWTSQGFTPGW